MSDAKKPMKRTMDGLREAMFDIIDGVRNGHVAAKDAKEACNAARVILESIDTQLTVMATVAQGDLKLKDGDLPGLTLSKEKPEGDAA